MKKFKKFIGILGLALGMCTATLGATLTDVPKTHWAYVAINSVADRGIMMTNSAGEFKANQEMTFFEVADVLAKATGYVDVEQVTGITDTFKEQIKANYAKQKPTLEACAKKYSTWNNAYNQQIAYILGRGYMKTADLDKFITKAPQGEVKNFMTKEQLSVYIVRILGKEKTATSTYTTTEFKDDHKLKDENKPYVAYLNSLGILNPDAYGNINGTTNVSRAVCAKMIYDALKINDTSTIGRVPSTTQVTTSDSIKVDASSNPLSSGAVINTSVIPEDKEKIEVKVQSITIQVGDETKIYTLTEDTTLNGTTLGESITLTLSNDTVVAMDTVL